MSILNGPIWSSIASIYTFRSHFQRTPIRKRRDQGLDEQEKEKTDKREARKERKQATDFMRRAFLRLFTGHHG